MNIKTVTEQPLVWKFIATCCLSGMIGWWSRQLTLEIPPAWFRDDVTTNTRELGKHNDRLLALERSDRYQVIIERLVQIEKRLDDRE